MNPRIVLITGPGRNHRYFIHRLNREYPIKCVLIEDVVYPEFNSASSKYREAWDWFFRRRKEYEENTFSDSESWERKNQPKLIPVPTGQINSEETLKILKSQESEIIILFGASLIGSDIMNHFPGQIINLHLGLSGEYRGSSCNFWPIYDERLDCLGATVLSINAGIDTGEILAQATIEVEEADTEQDLMGKTLIVGMELTIQVVRQWIKGDWKPLPLARNGKLFQKKEFTPEVIVKVKKMVESDRLASLIKVHLNKGENTT